MFNSSKDENEKCSTHSIHEMGEELNAAAHKAGRKVRSMINEASDEICDAGDRVTGEIRLHPMRSSMIALGVGVVLGALLRR